MEDELITKKTAILAKAKNFDEDCNYLWGVVDGYEGQHKWYNVNHQCTERQFSAPTQTALARWLRKNHGIHVEIYCNASGWGYILTKLNGTTIKEIEDDVFFETPEIACEKGLEIALNMIKI